MRALMVDTSLKWVDLPRPVPGDGEALIRLRMAGICNTDLEITRGYMHFSGVPGHEFVGEVVACDAAEWMGRRVVGEINAGCGMCAMCRRNLERHCPDRQVLGIQNRNGALAEFLTLPVKNLHEVPGSISDEAAVFTEPLAAACEILQQLRIDPDWRIAVLGDGKLGQLVIRVLRLTGADLTMIGRHPEKLALAEPLGVRTRLFEPGMTGTCDMVVEASGSSGGLEAAIALVRPRGIVVLKSTTHDACRINMAPAVVKEITITGSRCGPFAPAVRMLEQGLVDVLPLVTKIFPFSDALEAFGKAQHPGMMKILLDFGPRPDVLSQNQE